MISILGIGGYLALLDQVHGHWFQLHGARRTSPIPMSPRPTQGVPKPDEAIEMIWKSEMPQSKQDFVADNPGLTLLHRPAAAHGFWIYQLV